MTTKTTIDRVNVYQDEGGYWHYAAWCGAEHDCNGSLPEASTAAEAVALIASMWPAAVVKVVEPLA